MGAWREALGDSVLGAHCPGCARPGLRLCERCRRLLVPDPQEYAPGVWSSGRWQGRLRDVVLAWKLNQVNEVRDVLAWFVAAAVVAANPEPGCVLVPVPSTRRSRRERGRDLVADLADDVSRALARVQIDVLTEQALVLRRQTRDQSRLDASGRSRNLQGAMAARIAPGQRCLVIDDIATTGATLAEASRALTAAGAVVVGAATIASVEVDGPGC